MLATEISAQSYAFYLLDCMSWLRQLMYSSGSMRAKNSIMISLLIAWELSMTRLQSSMLE